MTAVHLLVAPTDAPTAPDASGTEVEAGAVTWLSPEAKLWVATQNGEFAGFVEFRDGHYEVTDARGHLLEPRGTLREAKRLIDEPALRAGASSALMYLAVGAGATAISFFAVAVGFIRLG